MIFQRIIQLILNQKTAFVFLLSLATLVGLVQTLRHLKVDNSLSIWFLEDNPDYQEYLQFQKQQGSDEIIIAMIPAENALSENHFETLQNLHQKIDSLDFVNATFSLINAQYPIYSNRKILYRNIIQPSKSVESIEKLLSELPNLKAQLLSENNQFSFFYLQLKPTEIIESNRAEIIQEITKIIQNTTPNSHISGPPILNEAFNETIYWESIFFAVLTVLVILGLLLFLLPHWMYLPIALLAIVIPVSISLGLMVSLGYSLNLISMLIPTVLMVYSISDVIHIINIFHLHKKENPERSKKEQIKIALQKSLKPCYYTTLTTVIGYLALYLSPLPAFKVMGLFTFFGLILSFCLVYVIVAIGFDVLNINRRYFENTSYFINLPKINIHYFTQKINHWTTHYNSLILGLGGLIFIIGIGLISKIEVNTDSLNLLGEGQVKDDLELIEKTLKGSARMQLNISKNDKSSIFEREDLQKLATFQSKLDSTVLLSHPISILNFQQFLEKRMPPFSNFNNVKLEEVLKNSENESNAFFSLFSEDFSTISININIKELETKQLEALISIIKTHFQNSFPEKEYQLKTQGFSALYVQLNHFILQTQFRSFGAAFLFAFLILFYFIGHFKTSFLALIPNLLPLCLVIILMVILKIDLEAANAMLAPIMLGIAMDDTIHLMNKYKLNRLAGMPVSEGMDSALTYTGGALFSTTISLVCGFLVVGLSGVASVSVFGILCAFTIVAALVADVVFLPALMKRFG